MNGWWALALSALLFASGACASDIPVGEVAPGGRPPPGSDEAALWYAMDRAESELQSSPLLVRDQALNAYVRGVACKVAADLCSGPGSGVGLRVYIVEQPWFNAMMAPNGMVIVWTGALLRARNEAELAFVIGHEAGHFRARHVLSQWRHSKNVSAWTSVFVVASTGIGATVANGVGSLADSLSVSRFSRDEERDADRMGFDAMVAAGYDPQATVELWTRLLGEEETRSDGTSASVFSSHPPTRERLDAVRQQASAAVSHGTQRNPGGYRAAIHPFLRHWLDAELARRQYAASILVVSDLLADASPDDKSLLSFYLGEAYRRRGTPSDRDEAARLYAQAIALPDPPADAWREHGLALRDAGKRKEAATALHRYLDLASDASDRAYVEHDLAELERTP